MSAVLEKHPEHAACLEALETSEAPFTDAHALAETFATLAGFRTNYFSSVGTNWRSNHSAMSFTSWGMVSQG